MNKGEALIRPLVYLPKVSISKVLTYNYFVISFRFLERLPRKENVITKDLYPKNNKTCGNLELRTTEIMCIVSEQIFGECRHVYKTEIVLRCPQYRWWNCYGEEQVVQDPMHERPYCRECRTLGEEEIRGIFMRREHGILQVAEAEHWSSEALSDVRSKLNQAQQQEIQSLRGAVDIGLPSAGNDGDTIPNAQEGLEITIF